MLVRATIYFIAHGTSGAARIRHSLRPLISRGRENYLQDSGAMRRENANPYLPSLRAQRSNPFFLSVARWIASRSLSSGAHSRDPVARNDDFGYRAQLYTTRPRGMSASAFCNGEPAISQALLDASDDAGQSAGGRCQSSRPAILNGQDFAMQQNHKISPC